jgi:tetratricopeptide (TPR) repeat protein
MYELAVDIAKRLLRCSLSSFDQRSATAKACQVAEPSCRSMKWLTLREHRNVGIGALLIAASQLSALSFAADSTESVTTIIRIQFDGGKGADLAERVPEIVSLVRDKRLDEAESKARALCRDYESRFQRDKRQFTFQTRADFEQFNAVSRDQMEWINWGYKLALQTQAFIAAERHDYPGAVSLLTQIESLAPVSAETSIELGHALNGLGRYKEALAAYYRAQGIAETFNSQRQYRPVVLRGIGFSLIELGDLDKAEKLFEDSLKLDPNNKVAINELDYIRSKRKNK